ncbi:hypothetical protein PS947_02300 [Pseudomonas fluorescens]|nr:hypothetical protein PS947_02300 [Pseudomonas fluorescens]
MIDVVKLENRYSYYIANLGEDVELIWTPAVDGSVIPGIPAAKLHPN